MAMDGRIHIAHLINPVRFPQTTELAGAQLLTYESMRTAAQQAELVARIDLLTAQYAEDHVVIPPFFRRTPDLERSVADVHRFSVYRKLPLIHDLVERLHAGS